MPMGPGGGGSGFVCARVLSFEVCGGTMRRDEGGGWLGVCSRALRSWK